MNPRWKLLLQVALFGALAALLQGSSCEGPLGLETGNVSGRVVRAADGLPIAGAIVTIDDEGTVTAADGRFTVLRVKTGWRRLQVQAEGYFLPGQPLLVNVEDADGVIPDVGLVPAGDEPPAPPGT